MKCEICGKDILKDSQCIDYKYYHNDCIVNLTKENQQLKEWKELHSASILAKENIRVNEENQELKEQVDYLRRSIERKEETIIDLEHERVPYTNEYVEELKKQLEEINKFKFSYKKDETKIQPVTRKQNDVEIIKNLENQQKEFINKIKELETKLKENGINE